MSRAVTTVSGGRNGSRLRVAVAVLIGGVLLGSAVYALAGTAPKDENRTAAPSGQPAPDRREAASTAVRFAQLLAVTAVRRPSVYGRRLEAIAAPGAERKVRAVFGAGAAEVRSLIRGPAGVLRAAPLGYRVDAFDDRSASVTVWMVAIAGGSRLEPTAQWRLLTLELVWTSAGWRVLDGSGGRGPSPRSPLPLLAAEASTFKELRHVP